MNRKIYILLIACLAIAGCKDFLVEEFRESDKMIENTLAENTERIEALENLCRDMNQNISSLRTIVEALQQNEFVRSVTAIVENGKTVGYSIVFTESGVVNIYNGEDGLDAHTPEVSVREEDGTLYWTVDGEWMLDEEGSRIQAEGKDGITPQFRITDGNWEISYDGGQTWNQTGPSTGNSFFSSVTHTDTMVVLTLADGTEIELPRLQAVGIEFDILDDVTGIAGGKTIMVGYTLTGADEKTIVTASSDGNYVAAVEPESYDRGIIRITCPNTYTDGFINVMATNESGVAFVKVISFYESRIIFEEGLEYRISPDGGEISIPYSVNFDYRMELSGDAWGWLEIVPETRAEMRNEKITLRATMNDGFSVRTAKLLIYAQTNDETPFTEITVSQESAYFTMDRSKYAVSYEGETIVTEITSSLGLTARIKDGSTWISVETSELGNHGYRLTATAAPNDGDSERHAVISLYGADDWIYLGAVEIVQLCRDPEDPEDMVFTVRANYVNEFTAYLPLAGTLDCYVDWGDGDVEYYGEEIWSDENLVWHKYDVDVPTSFEVRISGRVTRLDSGYLPVHCITEVLQWGKTGLNDMGNAFTRNDILTSIPMDDIGAFSEVYNFGGAFSYCYRLEEIPTGIFRYCRNVNNFNQLLFNCKFLTEIPDNLFDGCTSATDFIETFYGCSSLQNIPENTFKDCVNVRNFTSVFNGCTSLQEIPEKIFWDCANVSTFNDVLRNTSITTVPEKLFWYCENVTSFANIFVDCHYLTSVPVNIFDNNRKAYSFETAFYNCPNLTGESPYTIIDGVKYHLYDRYKMPDYFVTPLTFGGAFGGCGNLSDYEEIPSDWK